MSRTRLTGLVSMVVMLVLLVLSFQLGTLAKLFHGGGTTYHAQFTDGSGISTGDPVRMAGIVIGSVTGMHVSSCSSGPCVLVDFTVSHAPAMGVDTRAELDLDTLLGQHSLGLTPAGGGTLAKGATIALDHTLTPFSVEDALLGTANVFSQINTTELAKALSTVSSAIAPTTPDVRSAVTGLSALARTVGDRDQQVQALFAATSQISQTLAAESGQLTTIINNSGAILQTLDERQQVISAILDDTAKLSATITTVIDQNSAHLTPALKDLQTVLGVLKANQDNLDASLRLLAPYLRYFTNLTGNGRWFDGYIAGLTGTDLNSTTGSSASSTASSTLAPGSAP